MSLTWSDELLTGVNDIDSHHKELFKLMNWFFDACGRGICGHQTRRVFEFLSNYIIYHFDAEEAYMTHYNYPNYAEHKQLHTDFKKDLVELRNKFEDALHDSSTLKMLKAQKETNWLLGKWWVKHINETDKELGMFLRSRITK